MSAGDDIVLIPGKEADPFAHELSRYFGQELCPIEFVEFKDDGGPRSGETKVAIRQNIRGKDAYVLWSVGHTNYELMVVLQVIDAARLSCGVRRLSLVCPEFPFARQDKTHERRESLSSRLIARLLESVGLDEVLTADLHSDQIEGHFRIPLDHLRTRPIWAHYIAHRYRAWVEAYGLDPDGSDLVLGVPDAGRARAVRELSDEVGAMLSTPERKVKIRLAHHDKMRLWQRPYDVETYGLLGDVRGKVVWFSDDLLASGTTLFSAAASAKAAHARHVVCSVTHSHGFDREDANGVPHTFGELLRDSAVDELVVADTHPRFLERVRRDPLLGAKTTVLSMTPLFGEAIRRIRTGNTIKEMMREVTDHASLYKVVHEPTPRPCLGKA
jgi:ribose-phosphate pyrophosphokinase